MVCGKEIPERTNSLLLMLPDDTVTEAPLALRVLLKVEFDPTATFPKFNALGETDSWPAAVPVPESGMLSVESEASDAIATFPLAAPAPTGEKVTVNVKLWPLPRVVGNVNPLNE